MRRISVDGDDDLNFGFPIIRHCGSGRFLETIANPRKRSGEKSHTNSAERAFRHSTREKGFLNEKRFREMFERLRADGHIPSEYVVRKATRNQDQRHKVDAWIDVLLEDGRVHNIPIQIKSSWGLKRKFKREFGHRVDHIHVIVMDDRITLEILHSLLVNIFDKELAEMKAAHALE